MIGEAKNKDLGSSNKQKSLAPAGQDSFEEWIDFEDRLKAKYRDEYVPSEVFLAVRQHDSHVVGIIDFRHPLSDFLFKYMGGILDIVSVHQNARKGMHLKCLN